MSERTPCPKCNGRGGWETGPHSEECRACDGTGCVGTMPDPTPPAVPGPYGRIPPRYLVWAGPGYIWPESALAAALEGAACREWGRVYEPLAANVAELIDATDQLAAERAARVAAETERNAALASVAQWRENEDRQMHRAITAEQREAELRAATADLMTSHECYTYTGPAAKSEADYDEYDSWMSPKWKRAAILARTPDPAPPPPEVR